MVYSIPQDERIEILKSAYEAELISKAKDMAYQIVKLRKEEIPDKKKIDVYCYENAYNEDFTRKYILDSEEIYKAING